MNEEATGKRSLVTDVPFMRSQMEWTFNPYLPTILKVKVTCCCTVEDMGQGKETPRMHLLVISLECNSRKRFSCEINGRTKSNIEIKTRFISPPLSCIWHELRNVLHCWYGNSIDCNKGNCDHRENTKSLLGGLKHSKSWSQMNYLWFRKHKILRQTQYDDSNDVKGKNGNETIVDFGMRDTSKIHSIT